MKEEYLVMLGSASKSRCFGKQSGGPSDRAKEELGSRLKPRLSALGINARRSFLAHPSYLDSCCS